MTLQKINPDTLLRPHGYSQAMVASGSKFIYTSGQVAIDVEGNILALGDYERQAYLAARNIYAAVTASGATPADIVRLMVYVLNPTQDNLDSLSAGLTRAAIEAGAKSAAMTLIGVTGFSNPDILIELDATAIIG